MFGFFFASLPFRHPKAPGNSPPNIWSKPAHHAPQANLAPQARNVPWNWYWWVQRKNKHLVVVSITNNVVMPPISDNDERSADQKNKKYHMFGDLLFGNNLFGATQKLREGELRSIISQLRDNAIETVLPLLARQRRELHRRGNRNRRRWGDRDLIDSKKMFWGFE